MGIIRVTIWVIGVIRGFPKIRGYHFGSSHNKDYSILGSILGSPYFGKLPLLVTLLARATAAARVSWLIDNDMACAVSPKAYCQSKSLDCAQVSRHTP